MAKKQNISRDEQEKADMEKMQKRVENLLPSKTDLPAPISIQQADELKSRVRELEAKLAEQQSINNKLQLTEVKQRASVQVPQENLEDTEKASELVKRQKQIALWVARIFTGVGLIFFSFSIYNLFVSQGGQADLSDIVLMPATILMVIINVVGLRLIHRDRFDLGTWAMYFINAILLPVVAVFSTKNVIVLGSGYIVIFSLLFISIVIPRKSTWKAILVSVGAVLTLVAIEVWDPSFRVGTNHLETITPVVIALTLVAVFAFFVRQAIIGNIRAKLLLGFVIVIFVASLTGIFALQQQYGSVETTAVREATSLANTLADTVAQGQVDVQELVMHLHESQQRDVEIVDSNMLIVADANPEDIGTVFANDQNGEVAATLKDGRVRTYVEISDDFPDGIKLVVVPAKDNSGKITSAVIFEYTPLFNDLQLAQNIAVRRFIFLGLAGLLLAFVIVQIMSNLIARPISQLSSAALKIGNGQLDTKLPVLSSQDEVGILSNAFNSMTVQLRDLIGNLEQRVEDRTHDLELASEVGRTIAEKVEDLSAMLTDATEMIRSRFNLYYTQVYLLDPSGQTITLRAGTGTAGKQLLQRGHHLLVNNSSLNGRAVSGKKPVIVADTEKSGTFLPNPLLPNTRSEMAVPLLVGNKVLGVLDMQSEFANALNEENLAAFQVMAGQLSVAIQNAILFAQSEESRKQVEDNARHVTTVGWQDFLNGIERGEKIGYIFDQTDVKPLERKSKARSKNALSVPITVTGATVGTIQVAQDEREWTSSETLIIQSTADQLAQHIDNLRLLSQAEKYRQEAEQTTRRMTREGWESYLQTRTALTESYSFSPNEVKDENEDCDKAPAVSMPITVRDEAIGELTINADSVDHQGFDGILSAVVSQLGEHIENLRLLETTEYELAERTRTEQELLKVRLGMDRTNDAVFITETDGTIVYINPAFERIYGWTKDEVIGKTPRILKSGVIPEEQYKHFWTSLNNNKVVAGEIVNKTKDGRLIPIEGNNNPIVDADGVIIGFLGMHRDITDRKQVEETLRLAQRHSQNILESVTIPMVITRLKDNILTFINVPAVEVVKIQYEDAINRPAPNFYYDPEERAKFVTDLRTNGQVNNMTVQLLRGNGEIFWALISARIFEYQGEQSILSTFMDITDRIKAQEVIIKRAAELQTVAEVSITTATTFEPDRLLQVVVDLSKEKFELYHAHIYLADESWNTLLLAAGAGEVGHQMVAAGHAIQMDTERSLVARTTRERKAVIVNNVRSEPDFLPNPMLPETRSEMAVPMIIGDKVIGVFDVQSELEDRFTQEDASIFTTLASQVAIALQNARLYVEQAATVTQLRELDRLKSSFLANMSHELRTPLNSILGFADVMLEELDGPLTENMNTDLGLIQKNGQHLLHLINDVLDMAKIDSGKMNLHVEKFNVGELFMDVTSITSSLAKEKSVRLVVEADSDQEVEINADKIRLRQVMINLVNNAMKFTEKGQVSIRATREDDNVLISVKDTGIGIPADHLESVFQEFTQVDTTTTRKAGGTGLGLPISRRLINMHSGRLWAESTGINGEGATFYVTLPIEANINENITLAEK